MNNIDFHIPRHSCSFGRKELYFSSLAGLGHIAYGTALAVYKLVIYTHSLITQGHFFPRYETVWEAHNDIQPWQHLGYGVILLIPLIGSLFLLSHQERERNHLKTECFRLARNLHKAKDPRHHQLIIDLYILSYTQKEPDEEEELVVYEPRYRTMTSLDILKLCLKLELKEYAPQASLLLIKKMHEDCLYSLNRRDYFCASEEFERSVLLLEKLIATDPELRNNPVFQEAASLALQIYTNVAPHINSSDFAFAYAKLLESSLDPIEGREAIRAAFLEAGNRYEADIQKLEDPNRVGPYYSTWALKEKAATCFEKAGDFEKAKTFRPQAPPISPNVLSDELKEGTKHILLQMYKGENRAAFIEFINEFPDNPEDITALQQYLKGIKPPIKSVKRNLQRNCHPDRLEHLPDYVESQKTQSLCSLFLGLSL